MKTEVGFYKMHNGRHAVITHVDIAGYGSGYHQTRSGGTSRGKWCPDGFYISCVSRSNTDGSELDLKHRLV